MKKAHSDKNKDFKLPEQPDSLSYKGSFTVPSDYFKDMQAQISSKIETISKLKNEVGESHFKVPANYFEDLPNQIGDKISASGKNKFRREWLTILLKPQLSLAFASLLLLLWFSIKTRDPKTFQVPQSTISLDDLGDSEYIQYIDEYSIIEVLAAQEEITASTAGNDPYIQYLIDNNVDISQIEYTL